MRDISAKITTLRSATARALLRVSPGTIARLEAGDLPKGDPREVARVAAIQAAKNTAAIIPYCHPVAVDAVKVDFHVSADRIEVTAMVKAIHRTGVEMEALTAASVAALTLYDMMKMVDEGMEIAAVQLVEKRGGMSEFREHARKLSSLRAAVLVISDSVSSGTKSDRSGRLIVDRLKEEGLAVEDYAIVPDDPDRIRGRLIAYADTEGLDLVVTTGGTGFGPRDNTPEAMRGVIDREVPGIPEAARAYGQDRTPYSMLSRGLAGLRGRTLLVNLPGSTGGVGDSLDALFPAMLHAFKMIRGGGHPEREVRE